MASTWCSRTGSPRAGSPPDDRGSGPEAWDGTPRAREEDDARPAAWREVTRAIAWLRGRPRLLAPCPATRDRQRARCEAELGVPHPSRASLGLAARKRPPTLAEVCLVLSDLAPSRE